jgi:hypothetical protein
MNDLKNFSLFIIDTNMNGFGTGVYGFGQEERLTFAEASVRRLSGEW